MYTSFLNLRGHLHRTQYLVSFQQDNQEVLMFKFNTLLLMVALACSTATAEVSQTEFNKLVDDLATPNKMLRSRSRLISLARANPNWLVRALSIQTGIRATQLAFIAGAAKIESSFETLKKLASSGSPIELRKQCIVSIGQLRLASSLPVLQNFLKDTTPQIRLAATTALGRSMIPSAIPILAPLMQDEDKNVKEQAALGVKFIGRGKSKEVAEQMQALLKDHTLPDIAIISAMKSVAQNKLPQANIRAILTNPKFSPPVRVEAANALAINPNEENEAVLVANANASDASVLEATYKAIGKIGAMPSATLLTRRLRGLKGKIAIAAAKAAGDILFKYRDESYKTGFKRDADHRTLNQLIKKLQALLEHRDNAVKRAAINALGRAKNKAAIDALITTMRDNPSLKEDVHKALISITGKAYIRRADPAIWQSAKVADLPEEERLTELERIEEYASPSGGSKTIPVLYEPQPESSKWYYLGALLGVIFIGFLIFMGYRNYKKRAEKIEKTRRKVRLRSLEDDYYS